MATRSFIGTKRENGTIRMIYCHWGGSPEDNGKTLLQSYAAESKVKKLIAGGNVSMLREKLAPPKGARHTFDYPLPDVTVFHRRDRGDNDADAVLCTDIKDAKAVAKGCGANYLYLFVLSTGEWIYYDLGGYKESPKSTVAKKLARAVSNTKKS
jgi:hypothetical protein